MSLCSRNGFKKDHLRGALKFVEDHKIVPIVDTVLQGLDEAHRGFVSDGLHVDAASTWLADMSPYCLSLVAFAR